MILKKKVSGTGKFAPTLDKDKDVQNGDIVMICGEIREVETKQYGVKKVVDVKLPNDEVRGVWLNNSSINNLIEKYGEDTSAWMNKPCKCLLGITGTGKTMLILKG
jgi:hypothetical protein